MNVKSIFRYAWTAILCVCIFGGISAAYADTLVPECSYTFEDATASGYLPVQREWEDGYYRYGIAASGKTKYEKAMDGDIHVLKISRNVPGEASHLSKEFNGEKHLASQNGFRDFTANIPAKEFSKVVVRAKFVTPYERDNPMFVGFFNESGKYSADGIQYPPYRALKGDGQYHDYEFTLADFPGFNIETITKIRYTLGQTFFDGEYLYVESIKVYKKTANNQEKQENQNMLKDSDKIVDSATVQVPPKTKEPIFEVQRSYADSFSDVAPDAWYYSSVKAAYEFGFVNGKSDTAFDPDGNMTVAEAIVLACRLHDSTESFPLGEQPWYAPYVAYGLKSGFLKDNTFDSLERNITRLEMVALFAAALPEDTLEVINPVSAVPDIAPNSPNCDAVLSFYRAGITYGNDFYGSFLPDRAITRSEVAAILTRLADPQKRLHFELAVRNDDRAAYYLVDDSSFFTTNSVSKILQSGWDFDNRGGKMKYEDEPPYTLEDISTEYGTSLSRTLQVQSSGVVVLEEGFTFESGVDGFYLCFESSDGREIYRLYTAGGAFRVLAGEAELPLTLPVSEGQSYNVKVLLDLTKRTAKTVIDEKLLCEQSLSDSCDILEYRIGTTEEAVIHVTPAPATIYCNYLVNESCFNGIPYNFSVQQNGGISVVGTGDELQFSGVGETASVYAPFEAANGKVGTECIFLFPDGGEGFSFDLMSGKDAVFTVSAKNGKLYAGKTELRPYNGNMWYRIRIVADTVSETATVQINGKKLASVPLGATVSAFDGIRLSAADLNGKLLRIDDIKVYPEPDFDDYVPEPVLPNKKGDYIIGMNVCNIWRNGRHFGWDNISAYDEIRPVLGFYDEGLPETADWEIKFLAEHGIDFQFMCWYHDNERPLKTFYGSAPKALFDGFMNAKYSDKYGKFALLWELSNGEKPLNATDFRENFVEFWREYFFSDPRYMTIDNKLVISIFGALDLPRYLGGSTQAVKTEFDYVESVAKELGFDGCLFFACNVKNDSNTLKQLGEMGFDAIHAYNWNISGSSAAYTQNMISEYSKNKYLHNIPTASMGFNCIGWYYKRFPTMPANDFKSLLSWIKDSALPYAKSDDAADAWKSKLVLLSNWNEYGEGTYLMPSGLNGFGYLDAVREVFTDGKAHNDAVPTDKQRARIGHLYPINRALIRPQGYYKRAAADELAETLYLADTASVTLDSHWSYDQCVPEFKDGTVSVTSTGNDPKVTYKGELALDANDIIQMQVWMEAPVGEMLSIYFITDADRTWSQSKCIGVTVTSDGMNPVPVNMLTNKLWKGTVVGLRIDPVAGKTDFKIEKVELFHPGIEKVVCIDGRNADFIISPQEKNGELYFPFFPEGGTAYQLSSAYRWDKIRKRLTLEANGHKLVYTMGDALVNCDGQNHVLTNAPYLEDGIPMLPLGFTAEKLGYTYELTERDGKRYYDLITGFSEYADIIKNRKPNEWEFDVPGDQEGFQVDGAASHKVADGCLYLSSVGMLSGNGYCDPRLLYPNLSFDASEYSQITLRMKYDVKTPITEQNRIHCTLTVYFTTETAGLSESRAVRVSLDQSSGGEYVDITADLSANGDYKGKITGIRIDPTGLEGEFWIDSIRFLN